MVGTGQSCGRPAGIRIVLPGALVPEPWRNGLGITREIAREEDAAGVLWRLSLADVDAEGPFSLFAGMSRLLTVVSGAGMVLDGASGRSEALPLVPLPFSGEEPVSGLLPHGPVRNLNLVFRTGACRSMATTLRGPLARRVEAPGDGIVALHTVAGEARVEGLLLPRGATALLQRGHLEADAAAVLMEISVEPLRKP